MIGEKIPLKAITNTLAKSAVRAAVLYRATAPVVTNAPTTSVEVQVFRWRMKLATIIGPETRNRSRVSKTLGTAASVIFGKTLRR